MSDAVAEYREAYKQFEAAGSRIGCMVGVVSAVFDHLKGWHEWHVGEGQYTEDVEPEVALAPRLEHWPEKAAILQAAATWADAARCLARAWANIPEADRGGLKPPPDRRRLADVLAKLAVEDVSRSRRESRKEKADFTTAEKLRLMEAMERHKADVEAGLRRRYTLIGAAFGLLAGFLAAGCFFLARG